MPSSAPQLPGSPLNVSLEACGREYGQVCYQGVRDWTSPQLQNYGSMGTPFSIRIYPVPSWSPFPYKSDLCGTLSIVQVWCPPQSQTGLWNVCFRWTGWKTIFLLVAKRLQWLLRYWKKFWCKTIYKKRGSGKFERRRTKIKKKVCKYKEQ